MNTAPFPTRRYGCKIALKKEFYGFDVEALLKPPKDRDPLDADQHYLFSMMWDALRREEHKLQEEYMIAGAMACSEWTTTLIPSSGGGYYGLQPTRMLPEMYALLDKNKHMLRTVISRRRYALLKAFRPLHERTHFPWDTDMQACWDYWEAERKKKKAG